MLKLIKKDDYWYVVDTNTNRILGRSRSAAIATEQRNAIEKSRARRAEQLERNAEVREQSVRSGG